MHSKYLINLEKNIIDLATATTVDEAKNLAATGFDYFK